MAEDPVKNLGSIVPEVYYDLIARVPPGAFVVISLCALYMWRTKRSVEIKEINGATATLGLILLICAAYSVGLLLSPVARLVIEQCAKHHWKKQCTEWEGICERLLSTLRIPVSACDMGVTKEWAYETVQKNRALIYRRLHDYLKNLDEQAKTLLPKINAERTFCGNVAAGIIFVFIVLLSVTLKEHNWAPFVWLIGGFVLSLWACSDRTRTSIVRHFSYFELCEPVLSGSAKAAANIS